MSYENRKKRNTILNNNNNKKLDIHNIHTIHSIGLDFDLERLDAILKTNPKRRYSIMLQPDLVDHLETLRKLLAIKYPEVKYFESRSQTINLLIYFFLRKAIGVHGSSFNVLKVDIQDSENLKNKSKGERGRIKKRFILDDRYIKLFKGYDFLKPAIRESERLVSALCSKGYAAVNREDKRLPFNKLGGGTA